MNGKLEKLGQTLKSVGKLLLLSKPSGFGKEQEGADGPLLILGNGPSLRQELDGHLPELRNAKTLAVNFAANAPEFAQLCPDFYVLADPHFFENAADPNVARLLANLNGIDWEMTLLLPATAKGIEKVFTNPRLKIRRFNAVGAEGFEWFERLAYGLRWGMPRPRNVLIPSIMVGIWLGFREIYLLGADHSWPRTVEVDEQNRVVSVQPHFYKDNEKELSRQAQVYHGVTLPDILESWLVAFTAYHRIETYARSIGAKIYNATPGSFIDAFPRKRPY